MFVLIIVAIIYGCLPWYLEMACFIVNLFFPDPIPLLDELLMFVPIIRKLKRIIVISEIIQKYGKVILTVIVLLAIGFMGYLFLDDNCFIAVILIFLGKHEVNEMTYKELKKAYHFYEDESDAKSKDISYYTCPNCGYAVRSISINSLKCGGCGKIVVIQHGKVKGWR